MTRLAHKSHCWREVYLVDVVDQDSPICYGIVLPGDHVDDGVPVIKVKDIAQGGVRTTGLLQTSPEIDAKYKRSRLTGGDILLSIRGTVGRLGIVPDELAGANITQDTARIRISCSETRAYVYQALQSDDLQAQIRDRIVGQAVKGINIRDVKRLRLLLPVERHAQKYIAELLSTQDAAIQKIEQLIAAKNRRFAATSHLLLTSRKRLNGFSTGWGLRRADEIFQSTSCKGHLNEQLLSVTQDRGVIPRDMLEGRVTMPSGETGAFKLVELGNFVISLRSFQGGLEYSNYRGLVSPAYTVLREVIEIDKRFFRHYFKSADFIKRLSVAVIGIRDGKQISFQDFCSIKLPFPLVDEQKAIAGLLDEAESEIRLLQKYAESLKTQKRGLMQKLLTGQWQLPLPQNITEETVEC